MLSKKDLQYQIKIVTDSGLDLQKQLSSATNNSNNTATDNIGKALQINKDRLSYLTTVSNYLNSNPSEEFINAEIERISSRVSKIDLIITEQIENAKERSGGIELKFLKKKRKELESLHELPKLHTQLKCLKFILSS